MPKQVEMNRTSIPSWIGTLGRLMNIGIILLDEASNIFFTNDAACRLLGCKTERGLRRKWTRLKTKVAGTLGRAREENAEQKVELVIKKGRSGRRLQLEVQFMEEAEASKHLVIVKNMDLVHALEANLRHAIKMRSVARLFMAAAHDLKAPLNAISLNMELVKRAIQDSTSDDQKVREKGLHLLSTVQTELQRFNRSLNDVFNLTLLPRDAQRRFDIAKVLKESVSLLSPMAREQKVAIKLRITSGPIPVHGHRDRMKQALLNLFINALEAMPKGGELSIESHMDEYTIRILISDTGPGIPPGVLKKIWDMHFTTKEDGTGIGLQVSRSVIEALGGSIEVKSQVGHGTRFVIEIPGAGKKTRNHAPRTGH